MRADALFEESEPFIPYLYVIGESRQSGYLVRVQLAGKPDDLDVAMSSSPPLEEGQIVRLLATGKVERKGIAEESSSAAWILSQGLRYDVSEGAARSLPVESIDLQPTTDVSNSTAVGPEIVASERITKSLSVQQYVGVEDPTRSGVGAKLELTDHFAVSARARQNNVFILELIYEILF